MGAMEQTIEARFIIVDMLGVFKKWYGNDFKSLQHKTMGTVYYRMDGRGESIFL
jgi:hypothetical protein